MDSDDICGERYVHGLSQMTGLRQVSITDPLETEDHIRLLKLYPPGWPDLISEDEGTKDRDPKVKCDVYQVSVNDLKPKAGGEPLFSALSYAWGEGRPCRVVYCGSRSVKVYLNLYQALVWVRDTMEPLYLWVDRLCIHQEDQAEKSMQVQRMHRIFAQAHVITWLGHHDEIEDVAEAVLAIEELSTLSCAQFPSRKGLLKQWQQKGHTIEELYTLPWITLYRILARPYFQRLWIVQETVLAMRHEVCIGRYRLTSRSLERFAVVSDELIDHIAPHVRGQVDPTEWRSLYLSVDSSADLTYRWGRHLETQAAPQYRSTEETVESHCTLDCSDARDHVYSLVSLFQTLQPYPVNYALTTPQVFMDFAIHCISDTGRLHILGRPSRRSNFRTLSGLFRFDTGRQWTPSMPSWCPDWAGPAVQARGLLWHHFDASGGRDVSFVRETESTLRLHGLFVGKVATCSVALSVSKRSDFLGLWREIRSAEAVALGLREAVPISRLWKIFFDVLVAGLDISLGALLEPWVGSLPIKNRKSVALKKFGRAWMAKCAKTMFATTQLSVPISLRRDLRNVAKAVQKLINDQSRGARMFTTDNGCLGSGPHGLHVGDMVCVLYGGNVPFILRQVGNTGHYYLIGEAYVHGIMQGEAMKAGFPEQDFVLI